MIYKIERKGMFTFILTHIGTKQFPNYIYDSIEQIRLFHEHNLIYLALNKKIKNIDFSRLEYLHCNIIWIEDLEKSAAHKKFDRNLKFRKFWKVTAERFFIIEEIMKKFQIKSAIHIENDNLIYYNLDFYYNIISDKFDGIAFTKDNEDRVIAGIVFITDVKKLELLNKYLSVPCDKKYYSEMQIIGRYLTDYKYKLLPVIYPEYIIENNFESSKLIYSYMCDEMSGIFDAAAIGQYLGGKDKRSYKDIMASNFDVNVETGIDSYENPNAWYKVKNMELCWEKDEKLLWIPYVLTKDKRYKIFNIHVHSKELFRFKSNNRSIRE